MSTSAVLFGFLSHECMI